jgi:hypothetical protein
VSVFCPGGLGWVEEDRQQQKQPQVLRLRV